MLWTPPIWYTACRLRQTLSSSEIVWESRGMWLVWRGEKQQRRSGVVLIRRLLQRCGLGCGARTSREKQHWRLRGLPSAATAYPRMPLSPSPRGTVGANRTSEKTITSHCLPPHRHHFFFFLLPGETGKANRPGLVDGRVRLSDVLQNDPSHLVSYTLMHHIAKNAMKQEDKSKLSILSEQAVQRTCLLFTLKN